MAARAALPSGTGAAAGRSLRLPPLVFLATCLVVCPFLDCASAASRRLPSSSRLLWGGGRTPALTAVWIDRTTLYRYEDSPRTLVEKAVSMGADVLVVETFSRGAQCCTNLSGVPRDVEFSSVCEKDMLRSIVAEAHARNVKVLAGIWVFCAGTACLPGPLYLRHPAWRAITYRGTRVSRSGSYWFCPSSRGFRAMLASLAGTLAARYDIDGVCLDYVRLDFDPHDPGLSFCGCPLCRRWVGGGFPWKRTPGSAERRAQLVEMTLKAIIHPLRAAGRSLTVAVCVLADADGAARLYGQRWVRWLRTGLADLAFVMTYTSDPGRMRILCSRLRRLQGEGLFVVPIVGAFTLHAHKAAGGSRAGMLRRLISAAVGGSILDALGIFSFRDLEWILEGSWRREGQEDASEGAHRGTDRGAVQIHRGLALPAAGADPSLRHHSP